MKKVHRLGAKIPQGYRTLCGQRGILSITNETGTTVLQEIPFGIEHYITKIDKEVTCVFCIRKIIGVPRLGVKKVPSLRIKHIRRLAHI